MFCPRCGRERVSTDTSFCSRCGFLLAGTLELLDTGGVNPAVPALVPKDPSSRSRGIKMGVFIFLLTFLIVPIIAIITIAYHAEPYAVVVASILLGVGGLLRMAYALMFESPVSDNAEGIVSPGESKLFGTAAEIPRLSARQSFPEPSYLSPAASRWRDKADLQPGSVTDGTTRQLEKHEFDQ